LYLASSATHTPFTVIQSDVFAAIFPLLFSTPVLALFEAIGALLIIVIVVVVDIILGFGQIQSLLGEIHAAGVSTLAPIATIFLPFLETEIVTIERT
jgi:hypothetical protein